MASDTNPLFYEFDDFSVDVERRLLLRNGEPIPLTPKVFDTLIVFLENRGEVLDKDRLMQELWSDSFVEESNIAQNVAVLRRALGEKAKENKFIVTIPGRGYRFVAEVKSVDRQIAADEDTESDRNRTEQTASIRNFPQLVPRSRPYGEKPGLSIAISPEPEKAILRDEAAPDEVHPATRPIAAAKSSGRRRPWLVPAVIVAAVLIAVTTGVSIFRYFQPKTDSSITTPRLAVLPLRPVDAKTRERSVEFAVAEALILKLSESKAFNVRQLGAVRKYSDTDLDPLSVGRELNADYVLASNYQLADGRIRVTGQLLNIKTGETDQTFKSESDVENVFAMQDAVANEIGNAVFTKFGKPESTYASKRQTLNPQAFDLYYEALYLVDKNTGADSKKAADILGRAVELDPGYADAWALRAQSYCQFAHSGGGPPKDIFSIAEPMLQRALSIDDKNQMAIAVRGIINRDYHWDFQAAYSDMKKAVTANPGNPLPHRYLSGLYIREGRFAEAVDEAKKAVEIAPTSVVDRWLLGDSLLRVGRSDEGLTEMERIESMDPAFWLAYDSVWSYYCSIGDDEKAYENFIKLKVNRNNSPEQISKYREVYRRAGWDGVLKEELSLAKTVDPVGKYSGSKYYFATIAALAGDKDTAIKYLEDAFKFRLIGLTYMNVDPRLDSLRDDPRFQDILRRSGIGGA